MLNQNQAETQDYREGYTLHFQVPEVVPLSETCLRKIEKVFYTFDTLNAGGGYSSLVTIEVSGECPSHFRLIPITNDLHS